MHLFKWSWKINKIVSQNTWLWTQAILSFYEEEVQGTPQQHNWSLQPCVIFFHFLYTIHDLKRYAIDGQPHHFFQAVTPSILQSVFNLAVTSEKVPEHKDNERTLVWFESIKVGPPTRKLLCPTLGGGESFDDFSMYKIGCYIHALSNLVSTLCKTQDILIKNKKLV